MTSIAGMVGLTPFELAVTAAVLALLAPTIAWDILASRRRTAREVQMDSLLAQPLQPGASRICPKCLKWHSLEFVRSHPSELQGQISIYRCSHCDAETAFAAHHPRHAI